MRFRSHLYTFYAEFVYVLSQWRLARLRRFLLLLRHTRPSTHAYSLRHKKYRTYGSSTLQGTFMKASDDERLPKIKQACVYGLYKMPQLFLHLPIIKHVCSYEILPISALQAAHCSLCGLLPML
jgi:hypothetical protein